MNQEDIRTRLYETTSYDNMKWFDDKHENTSTAADLFIRQDLIRSDYSNRWVTWDLDLVRGTLGGSCVFLCFLFL